MPTARELLEQADVLMRRNRARAADNEIPVLTDAVAEAFIAAAPAAETPSPSSPAVSAPPPDFSPPVASPAQPASLDTVPELTEIVEEIEIPSILVLPEDEGEPSQWLGVAWQAGSSNGRAVDAARAGEPQRELPLESAATKEREAADASARQDAAVDAAARAAAADQDAHWSAVADDVRLQVLQQIETFAATLLVEELGGRMQPIIDRARAELSAAINAELAELLRAHVSGAIEREIERRRAARD